MTKIYLMTAGISGFLAVVMAMAGSYFFIGRLSPAHMITFNFVLQMQMFHTLAILAIAFFNRYTSRSTMNVAFYLFLFGILLFSFPVYVNSTTEVTGMSMDTFSFLIPIGGLLFIAGWITIFRSGLVYVHQKRSRKHD